MKTDNLEILDQVIACFFMQVLLQTASVQRIIQLVYLIMQFDFIWVFALISEKNYYIRVQYCRFVWPLTLKYMHESFYKPNDKDDLCLI